MHSGRNKQEGGRKAGKGGKAVVTKSSLEVGRKARKGGKAVDTSSGLERTTYKVSRRLIQGAI